MLILTRLLTLLAPLVSAAPFLFAFGSLAWMFGFQIASLLLVFVCFLLINKLNEKKDWQPLIVIEAFLISIYVLSFLMERRIFLFALSFLTLIIVWAWLEMNFKKNFKGELLAESISFKTIAFLIYATCFTSIYGLREFIVTPVWQLCIIVCLAYLLIFSNHLVMPSDLINKWKQILCSVVIQLQLFLIFLALPLPYYAKGALLASTFYSLNNVFELYKLQKNNFRNYLTEIAVFFVLLMLILMTTKW